MSQIVQSLNEKLLTAVRSNDIKVVSDCLDQGADVNWTDTKVDMPLHEASGRGFTEIATLLISRGANVNIQDNRGWTALHWAALYDKTDIIRLLISSGAYVNIQDYKGKTPYDLAEKDVKELLKLHKYSEEHHYGKKAIPGKEQTLQGHINIKETVYDQHTKSITGTTDFYCAIANTSQQKIMQFPFTIEFGVPCKDGICFVEHNNIQTEKDQIWRCQEHKMQHNFNHISLWFSNKEPFQDEECGVGCTGLEVSWLKNIPEAKHLRRLGVILNPEQCRSMFPRLDCPIENGTTSEPRST